MKLFVAIFIGLFSLHSNANVLGDLQTFAPNSDGLDFISVHTSRPLLKGFFSVGGHFSYAKDHMVVFKDFDTQDRYNYRDELVEFDLDIAYAVTDKFSVFFAAPTLLYQESDSGQVVDVEISTGVHTYRPGFKWTLGADASEFAVIGSVDILNVSNSPYTGVSSYDIYNLELAKTFRASGKVAYGVNAGYRWRTPTEIPVDANMFPLDDQFIFSVGRSAPAFRKSRWVAEGIFSLPVDKGRYRETRDASSIDLLLGFKHRILRNLNFDWGGTVEPLIDTQSPRYRVFVGLVYYFNPGWTSNQDRTTVPPPVAPIEEDAGSESEEDALSSNLQITPRLSEVFEGTVVRFKVRGGEAPYRFRVLNGAGRFNEERISYRAPLSPENAVIEVTDSLGDSKVAEVIVKTPPEANETIRIKNLNFIFDTDKLVGNSRREIGRIIDIFKRKTVSRIIVEGHTDSMGSDEYNEELSEKRAEAVRRIFAKELGLTDSQISAIGFGEARPIATNATEQGRLTNRRVDLKIYYD